MVGGITYPLLFYRRQTMKVAHFAEYAPNQCGMYHTVKDMVLAERAAGIEAEFIDAIVNSGTGRVVSRPDLVDGDFTFQDFEWAKEADVLVRHSVLPKEVKEVGMPLVMALHGRPESTFLLEDYRIRKIFMEELMCARDKEYARHIYFWEEFYNYWKLLLPDAGLSYVPAMVNLDDYSMAGQVYDFGDKAGSPNILIADIWREDVTPFNTIFAVARFREKYAPNAKLHIIGLDSGKNHVRGLFNTLKRSGLMGHMMPLVRNPADYYRAADILVTPHVIATRIIREATACGCPVVAGTGCNYTKFTANPMDVEAMADAINDCWVAKMPREEWRKGAEHCFNLEEAGKYAKVAYEQAIESAAVKPTVSKQGQKARLKEAAEKVYHKNWGNYDEYAETQKSKLEHLTLDEWDNAYYDSIVERWKDTIEVNGKSVLCLGARQGTEVRAITDLGGFALGIDLNPGRDNEYVVTGDFHDLKFGNETIDVVFTNSIDHTYAVDILLNEVYRVLKLDGLFILEVGPESTPEGDNWASYYWDNIDSLLEVLTEQFEVQEHNKFELLHLAHLTDQIILRKKPK
jgi:SAM-dependent methyltransferase/glycosyltransferase involved in cell wall biosynthesis